MSLYSRAPQPQQQQPPRPLMNQPNYGGMSRPTPPLPPGMGYQNSPQPQPAMGYGPPRGPGGGVSPLAAMLQPGPNPMLQQMHRAPSPNAGGGGSPGMYGGQNVSPRMQQGQWRPNLSQMQQQQQQQGQMQSGYANTDDVTVTYPPSQMHPGAGGQQ